MGNTLEDSNALFLHHGSEGHWGVLASSIGQPSLDRGLALGLNHCQKMMCGRESCIFGPEVDCLGMRCKVVEEDNRVLVLPV